MVARSEVLDDRRMSRRLEHAYLDVKTSRAAEGLGGQRDSLSRATETLMQTAAVVRRHAGQPQAAPELSRALGHVEDALNDLSASVVRIARTIDDEDAAPGGVAWRLHTLHHALHAARDLCAGARRAAPGDDERLGGTVLAA
jgi:ABC-type transporter Mla subunit MlaD